jgi:hypothetical protein
LIPKGILLAIMSSENKGNWLERITSALFSSAKKEAENAAQPGSIGGVSVYYDKKAIANEAVEGLTPMDPSATGMVIHRGGEQHWHEFTPKERLAYIERANQVNADLERHALDTVGKIVRRSTSEQIDIWNSSFGGVAHEGNPDYTDVSVDNMGSSAVDGTYSGPQ